MLKAQYKGVTICASWKAKINIPKPQFPHFGQQFNILNLVIV